MTKGPSDRAVSVALTEYQELTKDDVSEWFAMRMALEAAVNEDKKYANSFRRSTDNDMELGVILFGVAVASFAAGMLIRWLV